ncbi:Uncharacterised protein [Mycobacteroides abscessus subsp. abscessus]|nr:Uncharacterised protein [Mycobacteroides abscessus subsp. abscessus]
MSTKSHPRPRPGTTPPDECSRSIAASPAGAHDCWPVASTLRRSVVLDLPAALDSATLDFAAVTRRFATGRPMDDAADSSACSATGAVSGSTAKSRPAAKFAMVPTDRGR